MLFRSRALTLVCAGNLALPTNIHARAEVFPRAGEDDGTNVVIGADVIEVLGEQELHLAIERVPRRWAVKGDGCFPTRYFEDNGRI